MIIKKFNFYSSIIFIFLIVAVLLITFYKSEFVYNGMLRGHYIKPFIFFSIFLICLILIKKLNEFIQFNIHLSIWLICLLLIFFESFYVFKQIINPSNRLAEKNFAIEKSLSNKHYIRYLPGGYLPNGPFENFFPLSGMPNSFTVMCEEDSGMITYRSDRYGFNNFDKYWDKEKRIFLIGDSFIEGSCVDKKNSIDSHLNNLTNENFLSLGVGGNGPMMQLALLKEYAITNNTKEILWFFYEGNDLADLSVERSSDILNRYFEKDFTQNLKQKIAKQKEYLEVFLEDTMSSEIKIKDIIKRIIKLKNVRQIVLGSYSQTTEDQSKLIGDYEKIIIFVKNLLIEKNINLKFIYLPSMEGLNHSLVFYDEMKKMITENEIEFIDLTEKFQKIEKNNLKSYYSQEGKGHFNEKGYLFIAQSLTELM